jgi:hypothetical protein
MVMDINSMGWKELTRTYHATMDGRSKTILREQAEDELRHLGHLRWAGLNVDAEVAVVEELMGCLQSHHIHDSASVELPQ